MYEDFMKNLWLWKCGIKEVPITQTKLPSLAELKKLQWSTQFIEYMSNRLVLGAFRYGLFRDQKPGQYDCVGSIKKRLDKYNSTGNLEYLVDCSNICMAEFINGNHPKKHFRAQDDTFHPQ